MIENLVHKQIARELNNLDNNKSLCGQRRKLNLYEDYNNMPKEEIDKNIELFKNEYYCKWHLSKEYQEAYKLWLWYNYQCELFDSQVCTGRNEYEDYMPATDLEFKLSNKNAANYFNYILGKRKELKEQGIVISEEEWQSAKRYFSRHKLKSLEEEYKHYFDS